MFDSGIVSNKLPMYRLGRNEAVGHGQANSHSHRCRIYTNYIQQMNETPCYQRWHVEVVLLDLHLPDLPSLLSYGTSPQRVVL